MVEALWRRFQLSPGQALRALQLQEARWQAILDTARDAIIGIDTVGRVTLFNHAAEDIFGYASSESLGENVKRLMPSPYSHEHDDYLARYHATRAPKAIGRIREVEGRRKNGEAFPIEVSVSEARVGDDVMYSAEAPARHGQSGKHALEAIDGDGVVRVGLNSIAEDRIRIVLEDNGRGLPPGMNIFAMFETTTPTGTGLGLSICRQIVTAHGGEIDVTPRQPHGAVFGVELPLHGPHG